MNRARYTHTVQRDKQSLPTKSNLSAIRTNPWELALHPAR